MPNDDDDPLAFVQLILMMTWGFVGLALSLGFPTTGSVIFLLFYTLLIIEWLLLGMVGLICATEGTDESVQQRPDETNSHFLARAWVTLHLFVLKLPFVAIAGAPGAARRAVAWLRDTPGES